MEPPLKKIRRVTKRMIKNARKNLDARNMPDPGPLPVFMHPVEYSQLQAVVQTLAPRRVLEWGSGGSTRALLETCDFIEAFVSVEHHAAWFERVRGLVTDPRLQLFLCEPTSPEPDPPRENPERAKIISAWWTLCEEDPSILADYVAKPRSLGITFDFVLVDGRARTHCLREGWSLLRPGGILLIHDAQREEFHPTRRALGQPHFLEGWQQGQICFLRKPDAA